MVEQALFACIVGAGGTRINYKPYHNTVLWEVCRQKATRSFSTACLNFCLFHYLAVLYHLYCYPFSTLCCPLIQVAHITLADLIERVKGDRFIILRDEQLCPEYLDLAGVKVEDA